MFGRAVPTLYPRWHVLGRVGGAGALCTGVSKNNIFLFVVPLTFQFHILNGSD